MCNPYNYGVLPSLIIVGVICSLDTKTTLEVLCSEKADLQIIDLIDAIYYIEIEIDNNTIEQSSFVRKYTLDNSNCYSNKEYNVSVSLKLQNFSECSLLVRNNVHLSCPGM